MIPEATKDGDTADEKKGDTKDNNIEVAKGRPSISPSLPSVAETRLLNNRQREALAAQGSMAFWRESKDLLITLVSL